MSVKMDEAAKAKQRVRAGRLLLKAKTPPEVARTVGVPRQAVYRWLGVLQEHGIEGLREMSKGGRPARMSAEQLDELRELLLAGPIANGYGTDLWTLRRARLLIEKQFGITYSDVHVWRILGALGFSQPETREAGDRAQRRGFGAVEEAYVACTQKKPAAKAG